VIFTYNKSIPKATSNPNHALTFRCKLPHLFSTPKIVPPSRIKVALIEIKTCGLWNDHKNLTSNGDFFEAYQTLCVMDLFLLINFYLFILFYFIVPFAMARHLNNKPFSFTNPFVHENSQEFLDCFFYKNSQKLKSSKFLSFD